MEIRTIINILRLESIRFAIIGLIIAFSIFSLLGGISGTFGFIGKFALHTLSGLAGLYFSIWVLSKTGGKLLAQGKIGPYFAAILITFMSLLGGIFSASLIGYFDEGLKYGRAGISDYILTPILSVFVFGGIPAAVIGVGLGARLRKKLSTLS